MNRKKPAFLLFVLIFLLNMGFLTGKIDAQLMRYPDVSENHICFAYGGDIWIVEKEGGLARKISSPKGEESFPRFSPAGQKIAFTGNYDGNQDVYIVPRKGGVPKRITYHPNRDRLIDWTPEGSELIFASRRQSGGSRFNQLYHISKNGGQAEKYQVPYG